MVGGIRTFESGTLHKPIIIYVVRFDDSSLLHSYEYVSGVREEIRGIQRHRKETSEETSWTTHIFL